MGEKMATGIEDDETIAKTDKDCEELDSSKNIETEKNDLRV